jgi:hypothetical protein
MHCCGAMTVNSFHRFPDHFIEFSIRITIILPELFVLPPFFPTFASTAEALAKAVIFRLRQGYGGQSRPRSSAE